jgi:O-antigen/teichoic acid export membrane protein
VGVVVVTRTSAGLIGLIAAFALGATVGGVTIYALFRSTGGRLGQPSRPVVGSMMREAVPLGTAAIASALYFRVDVFLILFWAGEASVGIYGSAFKLIEQALLLATLLNASLLPVLVNSFGRGRFASAASLGALGFLGVGVAVALALLIAGGPLVELLYPATLAQAINIVHALSLVVPLMFLNMALNSTLIARGRSDSILRINLAALALVLTLGTAMIGAFGLSGAVLSVLARELLITLAALWLSRDWIATATARLR